MNVFTDLAEEIKMRYNELVNDELLEMISIDIIPFQNDYNRSCYTVATMVFNDFPEILAKKYKNDKFNFPCIKKIKHEKSASDRCKQCDFTPKKADKILLRCYFNIDTANHSIKDLISLYLYEVIKQINDIYPIKITDIIIIPIQEGGN